jgi:tetratricopeptide (TPR) repeat protein
MAMNLKIPILVTLVLLSCSGKKNQDQIISEVKSLDLTRGDITLCGAGEGQFGTVLFGISCSEKVRADFSLASALLHSFEYSEAEKVFAKVIDEDPRCVWGYWGAAMCNFHPMWAPPNVEELKKGSKIIGLARSIITDKSSPESDYIEAIATIYDQWEVLDNRTRLAKFEKACFEIFEKYPDDSEAKIFYSLALTASASPDDKTFSNQKKAGEILSKIFAEQPNHPGIAHYIIHTFDYPELALQALPTARKYAEIAPASAHAQHMPSHIFIRLGLWDESISSNVRSIEAAKCYAESMKMNGHWDEELHGLDYLTYAYLQQGNDEKALEQIEYLAKIETASPQNFKVAYAFVAMPSRYVLERKDWNAATKLELRPSWFPWEKFLWEKSNMHFGKLLGAVHTNKLAEAKNELNNIKAIHEKLTDSKEAYKANLVLIQIKISNAWITLAEGKPSGAIALMIDAANMEDATAKHPVTPGEVIPARELLGDMYLELNEPAKALGEYEADLKTHPNRFNGLYGAALAAEKSGDRKKALQYYIQLLTLTNSSMSKRQELKEAQMFVNKNVLP